MDNEKHQTHQCNAILIACMDFRLHRQLHAHLEQQYGRFDVVHLAGGANNLLKPETVELMLHQIELSVKLHGSHTVVLVTHEDCGDYGGKPAFKHDDEQEVAQHRLDLQQAAAVVTAAFLELKVVTFFERLDGTFISL
ncbi:MAG: hypothetical protein Q7S64_01725 [bacterium]|nr:hypothetical protein [bacterium]